MAVRSTAYIQHAVQRYQIQQRGVYVRKQASPLLPGDRIKLQRHQDYLSLMQISAFQMNHGNAAAPQHRLLWGGWLGLVSKQGCVFCSLLSPPHTFFYVHSSLNSKAGAVAIIGELGFPGTPNNQHLSVTDDHRRTSQVIHHYGNWSTGTN